MMSEDTDNLAELFGETLNADSPPPFQDGEYLVKGRNITMGTYKKGKFEGKRFGRFTYEIAEGEHKSRQASQMLPWLPGWQPFEINFKKISGMTPSEFSQNCQDKGHRDAQAQADYFLSLFKNKSFKAEVRQQGEWLNIWELKERLAGEGSEMSGDDLMVEISKLMSDLGYDQDRIKEICQEEYGVSSISELEEETRGQLRDLLLERKQLSQTESQDDDLPF